MYPGFRPRIGHPPNLTGFGLAHAELDGFTAQYMRSQQPIPFHFKFGFEDGALLHLIPELTDGVCLIRTFNAEPLEDEYSVEIPAEDLEQLTTVGEVMNYLKGKGVEA